jgi:hypothetical protein
MSISVLVKWNMDMEALFASGIILFLVGTAESLYIILEGMHLSNRKIQTDNYSVKLCSFFIDKLVFGGSNHFKFIV